MRHNEQSVLRVRESNRFDRETEDSRMEIENKLSEILAHSGKAIVIVGPHLDILDVNEEFRSLLGYETSELLTKTTMDLTVPEDRATTKMYERDLWSGRLSTYEIEKSYLRADGTPILVHLRSFIVSNDLGEPVCEMKVVEPVFKSLTLMDRIYQGVVSTFQFPEMAYGLPVQ